MAPSQYQGATVIATERSYTRLERHSEATARYCRVLQLALEPEHIKVNVESGQVLYHLGRFAEAIADFLGICKVDP